MEEPGLCSLPGKILGKIVNALSETDCKSARLVCRTLREAGGGRFCTVRVSPLLSEPKALELSGLPAINTLEYRFGNDAHVAEVLALLHRHECLRKASVLKLSGRKGLLAAVSVFKSCCSKITSLSVNCQHKFKHSRKECEELTQCLGLVEGIYWQLHACVHRSGRLALFDPALFDTGACATHLRAVYMVCRYFCICFLA